LTPVSGSGGSVFVGKLDASMQGDAPHAYVPNLAAQGSGYTFADSSGVAQRLLGNFAAGREEQEASVVDALKARALKFSQRFLVCFFPHFALIPPQLVSGWSAVDQSVSLQVAAVYCRLVAGERALDMCCNLVLA
jgi:hypothetical protein